MSLQSYPPKALTKHRKNLWFERFMAIAAATNLVLVIFDLTYLPCRNFWLQGNIHIPMTGVKLHVPIPRIPCRDDSVEAGEPPQIIQKTFITCLYDPVKGIQPHRDTQTYLATVNRLEQQMTQNGIEAGLRSSEAQGILKDLRAQSTEMIQSNPFAGADKTRTLERIKNQMRRRVNQRVPGELSSRDAFDIFWSTDNSRYPSYLSPTTWDQEIRWFNSNLRPLIETNYYRTISENGRLTNNFWMLDAPFVILFFVEFLARTFYISRRYSSLSWLEAMVWRWYDIPLFVPFSLFVPFLALTRIVPVDVRLQQSEILDFSTINAAARQGFVGAIAEEMTEVIIVQLINQFQDIIRRGEITEFLKKATTRHYIDLNNVNEIEVLSQRLIQLLLYQVFPKVQPDLEALLRHSINSVLSQSPAYRGLTALPGLGSVPGQLTERIVADVTQTAYNSLKTALEDPKTVQLTLRLVQNFSHTLASEAHQSEDLEELQTLLSDLLEEIKVNYVQRISDEDASFIVDQTRQLKQLPPR